jgi:hypothetical protein
VRPPADGRFEQNIAFVDPQIADTDLRLRNASPATDRATQLPEVALDINGIPRPQGAAPDIGAHETGPGAIRRDAR